MRIEKLLELFGAELRGEGGFFHHTDKVEGGADLRDMGGRKIGVRRWCSWRVIAVKPWWRRRGWRRKGRGRGTRRRRWVGGEEKEVGVIEDKDWEIGTSGCPLLYPHYPT